MADTREAKRVRQACSNCRRKKARCSGERPVCAFCAHLGQTCSYNDIFFAESDNSPNARILQQVNSGLAARVALLESRLSMMDANGVGGVTLSGFGSTSPQPSHLSDTQQDFPFFGVREGSSGSNLASLLDTKTLQSLADVYFRCCHKQPYCYFDEEPFRQSLENETLPSYLLLAFVATSIRFSDEACFAGRQAEATEWYSRMAWSEIVEQSFSDTYGLDIRTVQATNMLGVVDFVSGREQLSWVKVGLAVRFAQTLQLDKEPDHSMPPSELEERYCTFWSVYLLDRLISCGRNRPPSLLDSDCTIQLPSNLHSVHENSWIERPTLAEMHDVPDAVLLEETDHFALTVFMVSTLGCVVRWAFKHSGTKPHLPWDSRSEFSRINGILLSFESYSDACDSNFTNVLNQKFVINGVLNVRAACHFTYSHVIYHVNQLLLHHPFLLHQHLRTCRIKIPAGFCRGAVRKSKDHASHLTAILRTLQQRRCTIHPSFYGYAAILAGQIHRLHFKNSDSLVRTEAKSQWEPCLRFLDQEPMYWESYRTMSTVLRDFDPSPSLTETLLSSSFDPKPFEPATDEMLWHICDYNWLTNSARRTSNMNEITKAVNQDLGSGHSPNFEALLEGALCMDYSLLNHSISNGNAEIAFH